MTKRVVLVTGAGRGLGECIARSLHAAGFMVAAADIAQDHAECVAASLDPSGATCISLPLDVRSKSCFESARDALTARWGGTDALVNNAAITRAVPIMDITAEEFDESIAVNLRGVFFGCQVFGKHFAERGYGRIVNIASLAGQSGGSGTGGHYAAAKGGVATLTKVFAKELAPAGVTVNAVAPGPLDLPIVKEILSPEKIEAIRKTIPVGVFGDPNFIARMVAMLVSEESQSVTGACWDANGGLLMR